MRIMQTTNGAGTKAGMTALLLAACFIAVFLMGCQNPLNMGGSEVAEGGTGTLSLTIDRQGAGRAILPVWPDDLARLRLAFDPRCDAGNDPDYEIWTGDMDSIQVELYAGLWYLHVTAYLRQGDNGTYRAIASGSVLGYFEIVPYDEATAEVTLLPIRLGQGTFSWEIGFPADLTMARMEITDADDSGTPPIRYYFVGGTPEIGREYSMGLDAGQYRVSITLSGPLGVAGLSTALRVYRYMDSFFEYEFTPDHFLSDPVWGIELSQMETRVFAPAQVGYSAITPATITVENTGNRPTGALTVALSGANPGAFAVTGSPIASIAVDGTDTFTVGPALYLEVGTHTTTVTVSGGANITAQSFDVSFTVTAEPPPPVWAISLDAPATQVFDALTEGYTADEVEALAVIVTNMGNQATGELSVELSGANPDAFSLTGSPIASIAAGETSTFTVRPNTGLAAGTHTATVTVSGDNDISESFYVSFTVTAAEPTPTWGIELDAPAIHTFPALTEGYTEAPPALPVTVQNTGNQATGALSVALSGANPGAFSLTGSPIASIAAGETGTFTVRPNTGLAVGTHTATVTVSGGNGISESFGVSFRVNAVDEPPPALGTGAITITFAEFYAMQTISADPISLANPGTRTIQVENPGQYDHGSITWFHMGNPVAAAAVSGDYGDGTYGEILDLNAIHGNRTGTHSVTVEVRRGGTLYSQTIRFAVTN